MLSIVTIAYNQRLYTEMFLKSISNPRCADESFDLIFIDNGSTDGTPELVQGYPIHNNPNFNKLYYYAFPENMGVAAAINKGVELSKRKFILQADNDIVFGPGSFSTMKRWLDHYPDAMVSPNWPWIQKKLGLQFFKSPLSLTLRKMKQLKFTGLRAPVEPFRATGSCWMCSKQLFEKVEGWDTGYKNICASDDFLMKIAISGASRFTVPCPVYHPGKVTRINVPKSSEQQEKDLKRFHQKWGGHPEDKELFREQQIRVGVTPDPIPEKSFWKKLFFKKRPKDYLK